MTGVRITVNDRDVQDALRALARLGRDPGPFLRPLGLQLINSTRERALREVSPQGNPWPRLNAEYQAGKRGTHMLRESGNLLGSLTREVQGNALTIGTNRVYAAMQQFGGTIRPRASGGRLAFRLGGRSIFASSVTIPARPFLGISADDLVMIREEFEDFAARAIRTGR
jgi:phage virion morphogenesis protein